MRAPRARRRPHTPVGAPLWRPGLRTDRRATTTTITSEGEGNSLAPRSPRRRRQRRRSAVEKGTPNPKNDSTINLATERQGNRGEREEPQRGRRIERERERERNSPLSLSLFLSLSLSRRRGSKCWRALSSFLQSLATLQQNWTIQWWERGDGDGDYGKPLPERPLAAEIQAWIWPSVRLSKPVRTQGENSR